MKKLKKVLAVVLVVVMAMAITTAVFAATAEPDINDEDDRTYGASIFI